MWWRESLAYPMTHSVHPYPAMPLLKDPPSWNGAAQAAGNAEHVGHSVLGNAVNLYHPREANLLVMGGVHGDESEGIFLAHLLLGRTDIPVLPCANPDGAFLRQRWNARNVDLNRNLPSHDWQPTPRNPRYPPGPEPASEPETQAFQAALARVRPSTVLSLHSFRTSFVEIERPPETTPRVINEAVDTFVRAVGIERHESIGYPTPGALGSFAQQNGLLALTYELERGASHGELYEILPHLLRLLEALEQHRFVPPEG